jgi:hypothetical protein
MDEKIVSLTERIAIEEQRKKGGWLSGKAICTECGNTWVHVRPAGEYVFTCPKCNCDKGVAQNFCGMDAPTFTCGKCSCQIFRVSWLVKENEPSLYCANCGNNIEWGEVC